MSEEIGTTESTGTEEGYTLEGIMKFLEFKRKYKL